VYSERDNSSFPSPRFGKQGYSPTYFVMTRIRAAVRSSRTGCNMKYFPRPRASCPALCRASTPGGRNQTSRNFLQRHRVDGRDKHGHDVEKLLSREPILNRTVVVQGWGYPKIERRRSALRRCEPFRESSANRSPRPAASNVCWKNLGAGYRPACRRYRQPA